MGCLIIPVALLAFHAPLPLKPTGHGVHQLPLHRRTSSSVPQLMNGAGKDGGSNKQSIGALLFGPLARKAEQAKQADDLWRVTARAFTARGKADLDALRAFSTLLGMGDEFDKLQRNFGVDGSNATDPSAEMLANMGEVVKAGLTSSFESPYERRQCLALSVILGMLMVEVVQLLVVLPVAWLIGAGLSAAPGGQAPLGAALSVALRSRHMTRPLRLGTQIWATMRIRRELRVVPPRRRVESAARCFAIMLAVVGTATLVLTQADKALFDYMSTSRAYASSALGLNALTASIFHPPLVVLMRAIKPTFAEPVASACTFLRGRGRDLTNILELLAEQMRRIKPLNALLDLSETDAWFVDSILELRAIAAAWV